MNKCLLSLIGTIGLMISTSAFAINRKSACSASLQSHANALKDCTNSYYKVVLAEDQNSAVLFINDEQKGEMNCTDPHRDSWTGAGGLMGWTQLECKGEIFNLTINGLAYKVAPYSPLEMNGYLTREQNGVNQSLGTLECK